MEEKKYTVSEAVRLIGVESHVLRYWEEELTIPVERSAQGHRLYSEQNIALFRQIRHLKDCGLQLKAIRMLFQGETFIEEPAERGFTETEAGKMSEGGFTETEAGGMSEAGFTETEAGKMSGVEFTETDFGEATEEGFMETESVRAELITVEDREDRQNDQSTLLVAALRQMMQEVVKEQNNNLEQRIADSIRTELQNEWRDELRDELHDELDTFSRRYLQAMQEAAAGHVPGRKKRKLRSLLEQMTELVDDRFRKER